MKCHHEIKSITLFLSACCQHAHKTEAKTNVLTVHFRHILGIHTKAKTGAYSIDIHAYGIANILPIHSHLMPQMRFHCLKKWPIEERADNLKARSMNLLFKTHCKKSDCVFSSCVWGSFSKWQKCSKLLEIECTKIYTNLEMLKANVKQFQSHHWASLLWYGSSLSLSLSRHVLILQKKGMTKSNCVHARYD